MNPPGKERWVRLWRDANGQGNPLPWFERLKAAWSEPHRRYHNLTHLAECFREFDPARSLVNQPLAVEFALWFHDAVYDPRAADNEERSAALAESCLAGFDVPASFVRIVAQLILATKHHDHSVDAAAPLMVDVDLSILGQSPARFREYEAQIREEYAWVPALIFAQKRAEILDGFLKRDRLFTTDWFRSRYETQARANLEESIRQLK